MDNITLTGEITYMGDRMEIKGTSKSTKKDYNFQQVEVVITEQEGDYPSSVAISFIKDKCDMILAYKVGDVVSVGVNFRCNTYEKDGKIRNYNTINGRRVSGMGQSAQNIANADLPF